MNGYEQIIYSILGMIVAASLSYWAASTRGKSEELSKVVREVEQLKVTSVSESRVREIIKDAIEPTGSDVREIKTQMQELTRTLHAIELELAAENAYKRGRSSNTPTAA